MSAYDHFSDVRKQADKVSMMAQCFFVLMGIPIICAFANRENMAAWLSGAGGCLSCYFLAKILAQLLCIRATLDEQNSRASGQISL